MARSKQKGITFPNVDSLPEGVELRQRITRSQLKDENGDTVRDDEGNPVWERETVDVLHLVDAKGEKWFRAHVTDNGPDGYDGGMMVRDLLNNHLAGYPVGTKEIDTAPSTSYVDPLEAAQTKISEMFKRGERPTPEQIAAIYAEVAG